MLGLSIVLKLLKAPGLKCFTIILNLIATVLLVFLALACRSSSSVYSEIYLIEATTSSHTYLRSGYFRMCETPGNSTASALNTTIGMTCKNLGDFKSKELAYEFSKHVARPYFVVIAAVFSIIALFLAISSILISQKPALVRASFTVTALTLVFSLVTACWQQVAVQAAVVLIPNSVKRGYRASGMVWSAVTMLILSTIAQLHISNQANREQAADGGSLRSADSQYSNMMSQKTYHQHPAYISNPHPV